MKQQKTYKPNLVAAISRQDDYAERQAIQPRGPSVKAVRPPVGTAGSNYTRTRPRGAQ